MNKILIHIYGWLHRNNKKYMLKKNTNGYDNIIKNILIKIFDIYYLDRNIQKYNN